jgi:hypothetical protein
MCRTDAETRIDTHRKSNLDLQVVDMNGDPVEGATVSIKMKSNNFKFSGTFSAKDFDGVPLPDPMTRRPIRSVCYPRSLQG